ASADVRHHYAVLAPELGEKRVRVVSVRRLIWYIGRIADLSVGGSVHGLALAAVVHVAVAAHRRVGRPLVARKAHEATGRVELPGQRVELAPKGSRDLEVVALVPHDV